MKYWNGIEISLKRAHVSFYSLIIARVQFEMFNRIFHL